MIGIVESGSTKSEWVFVDNIGNRSVIRTSGLNPYYQSEETILKILKDELLPKIQFTVKQINFYGAGCEAVGNKIKMKEALQKAFSGVVISIDHDLMAAAKALFGDSAGIACIAGTGSNTCYYDGKEVVRNISSLGLYLGDEGSGGHMGKALIKAYIRRELPENIHSAFEAAYPDRKDEILLNIYSKPMPSKYLASFAPFLKENIDHSYIYQLVYNSFLDLFTNCIEKYENGRSLPLGFVGSIAYHFQGILKKVAQDKGYSIQKIDSSPFEALTNYHLSKSY
ncbi:MAG: hypothetical protein ACK4ND_01415 [Cytophagaceae bacterium]